MINQDSTKNLEKVFREKEGEKVMAETVPLGGDTKLHRNIWKVLKEHEYMWLGQLGKLNVTYHQIDVIPGLRPFKFAPYCAGPNTENWNNR